MQENEFEKRVQQQMDEFRLKPSCAVWEKVEGELKKKKKRRVVFYIFLLTGLSLLGYSGYFLFNQSKQNLTDQNSTLPDKNQSVKENTSGLPNAENRPVTEQQAGKEKQGDKGKKEVARDKGIDLLLNNNSEPGKQQHAGLANSTAPGGIKPGKKPEKNFSDKKQKTGAPPANKAEFVQKNADVNNLEKNEKNSLPAIVQKDADENNQPGIIKDDVSLKRDRAITKADVKEKETPVMAKKNKTNFKINWGLDFSAGISDTREKTFLFSDGHKSTDAFYSSPNTGGPLYNPPVKPSSVKPGFAFKLGPVGELKISKRSRFSFGLQYAFMSTKMHVGTYRDTAVAVSNRASQNLTVDAVYGGTHWKEYTNHYHFLQMPLQYHWQINKGKKLPIIWNIGTAVGYLLTTNALVYDTSAGGIYYRDNDVFNKMHFNLNTGFSFRFDTNKRIQWSVGPELALGMNKLMKDSYDTNAKQYLLYAGLTGRLIFSSKNKK